MHIRSHHGLNAEKLVADHLQKQGFTIIARNYRKRYGEIDLIAKAESLVAFVEVKMRHHDLVDLGVLVTRSKQKRIIAVAREFIARNYDLCSRSICRFDVALVHQQEITYIPQAFTESERADRGFSF